ncbi:unnamed protein product, partial [Polarella glacialis]
LRPTAHVPTRRRVLLGLWQLGLIGLHVADRLRAARLRRSSQGSGLVSVDSSVLAAAATWLVQLQNSEGSFKSIGNVIHTEMMGGAGSSIALTAFVASALAKANTEVPALAVSGLPQALQKAGAFLSGSQSLDTYSGLLRAHAMALSGLWTSLQVADAALAISSATTGRRFWTSS